MQTLEAASEPVVGRVSGVRTAWITGGLSGLATFCFLVLGASRAYDLDDSITVGLFVATPSISDAFTRSYVLNNQVFFSFLDHLVYSATGSRGEPTMRMLPIVFGAVAVGLLAGIVSRHWGWLAGVTAALVMATNPTFADVSSQVRGYSLVVLCTIATTAILLNALRRSSVTSLMLIGYGALGAVGVATHLYMLVVLGIHVVISLSDPRVTRRWILPWLGAGVVGIAAYVKVWRGMRETADFLGRNFRPGFPVDASVALFGGTVLAAVLLAVVVLPVWWRARTNRVVQLGTIAVVVAFVAIWIVAPFDLYPRFFVWLVPLPALGAAVATARRPVIIALVGAVVVLQLVTLWPRLTEDPVASAAAAQVFARVRARGGTPCAADTFATIRLIGYGQPFSRASTREQMAHCTVVVMLGRAPKSALARAADSMFPHHQVLRARSDGDLWSAVPVGCWLTDRPARPRCRVAPG